jgi:hypothetical protein
MRGSGNIELPKRSEQPDQTEPCECERGTLWRTVGVIHVRIGPGADGGFYDFFEIAVVVQVETHSPNDERQQKEWAHNLAGCVVPPDKCETTGDRHEAGVDDREPRDRMLADDIDVFDPNVDHQAGKCPGEKEN